MDFSSLDLLASTALRENNPSPSPTAPSLNHHDADSDEDDEDEPDEEKDSTHAGLDNGHTMGSVKVGKNKKGSASKPVLKSIFVKDGKYVTKKVSVNQDAKGDAVILTDAVKIKEELEICHNNNSVCNALETPLPPEGVVSQSDNQLYNGKQSIEISNSVQNFTTVNTDFLHRAAKSETKAQDNGGSVDSKTKELRSNLEVASAALNNSVIENLPDICSEKVESRIAVEPTLAENCVLEVSAAGSDSQNTEDSHGSGAPDCSELHSDAVLSSEKQEKCESSLVTLPKPAPSLQMQESEQASCHDCKSELQVLSSLPSADGLSMELQASSHLSSTRTSSSSITSSDTLTLDAGETQQKSSPPAQTLATEISGCSNCDENRAVLSAPHLPPSSIPLSPQSPSCSLPHSSPSTTVTGREKKPTRINTDQDYGSSGNTDSNPSTSSSQPLMSPPHPPHTPETDSVDTVFMDHCYFSSADKLALGQSAENTDDSGDAFESADENVSADDIERRPRSLSVDSEYLQYGVPPVTGQSDKMSLLSPTLSVESISNDSSMSEHSSATGSHFYSILTGGQPARIIPQQKLLTTESFDSHNNAAEGSRLAPLLLESNHGGPKCGKFRIGTFGSFSNSHLDLEADNSKRLKIGIPTAEMLMKSSNSSPALVSPGSPFPLLQSPGMEWDRSDAGSEAPDDLDSSTTEDRFLSSSHDSETYSSASSGLVWNHPVFHDHDYFCKEVSEKLGKPIAVMKSGKRKNTKKKDKYDHEDDKLRKGKYLRMELLRQDNRFSLGGISVGSGGNGVDRTLAKSSLLAESLTKPNPVGRPRKRLEKPVEEYDSETGTKMKITGKYQDQYVYYYSKTSRNRRRKFEEKAPQGDKIILPPSKPGDIVVPHLTDADCEAIKRGGRAALKTGGSAFSTPHLGVGGLGDHGDIMDSSIVNTILSMESDNLTTPSMGSPDGDGDFGGIEDNLTTEQVDLLLDCLKDVEVATTSQALDSILTSAESMAMVPHYMDSLAATTVESDFLVPMSTPSCLPAASESTSAPMKTEPADVLDAENIKQEIISNDVKPAVSISVPSSQLSVEKNLEFLKNPDIKPEFYPVSVPSSVSNSNFVPISHSSAASPEAETPWIVTVTLYWNDIPAIIINNSPYVRLVDIHRQILPAKDTGILKKRCQLMHIQVSNCTEMQRYFLVQYGRAHNSKSTLVITKDEAFRLISYYANPQPRNLRAEEGTLLRRSSSYAELQSYMSSPGNVRSQTSSPAPGFAHPRKRGGFRRRNTPNRSRNTSPEAVVAAVTPQSGDQPPPSPLPAEPASPSKRLRHKKINFLEMLKGEDSSHSAPSPLVEGGVVEEESLKREEAVPIKAGKGSKRRSSKDGGEGSPCKRGRTQRTHSEEMKKILLGATALGQTEPEISVDDSPDDARNKKRSPGLSTMPALGATNRSPKSSLGPIKVNVKSLVSASHSGANNGSQLRKKNLFGRKLGSTDTGGVECVEGQASSRPLRVLSIAHQDAEAASPRPDASPVAEIHLDLYKRASSLCVHCGTCDQFLTVAAFLKHHHPEGSSHGVVSSKRMIVPVNKENMSREEQRLWKEFVGLQERLDHSGNTVSTGAFPLSPQSAAECPPALDVSFEKSNLGASLPHSLSQPGGLADASISDSAAVTDSSLDGSSVCGDATPLADRSAHSPWEPHISVCSPPPFPLPSTHTELEEKLVSITAVDMNRKTSTNPPKVAPAKKLTQPSKQDPSALNVRTSSRKRKRKQFYGFENYDFAAGGKRSSRGEGEAQDSLVDVTGTMTDDENNVNTVYANSLLATCVNE